MKGRGWRIAVAGFFIAGVLCAVILPVVGVPARAAEQEDLSYWDRFKMLFIDWDDNAEPGEAHTETVGVRGLDMAEAIGNEGHDWEAVRYMETFFISLDEEMRFLQEGRLGPYQNRQ